MRILLAGATGFIGRHLVRSLAAAGHEVVGCARERAEAFRRHPEIGWIRGDFATDRSAGIWEPRLFGFDAVINAAGILREDRRQSFEAVHFEAPCALFQACVARGVRKVVQISTLGRAGGPPGAGRSTKLRAERFLATLDLDWLVVRLRPGQVGDLCKLIPGLLERGAPARAAFELGGSGPIGCKRALAEAEAA